ncbi:MAG: hypothetical protein ABI267_07750 [Ginsengibacter sp.]
MKKIMITLLIAFIACSSNAQLSGTKWKGALTIQGGAMTVEFNFSNDTLDVINTSENESLETMKYTLADSVISLQKLYGSSSCDTAVGKYKYAIAGNELTLSVISDNCPDRSAAIGSNLQLKKEE